MNTTLGQSNDVINSKKVGQKVLSFFVPVIRHILCSFFPNIFSVALNSIPFSFVIEFSQNYILETKHTWHYIFSIPKNHQLVLLA